MGRIRLCSLKSVCCLPFWVRRRSCKYCLLKELYFSLYPLELPVSMSNFAGQGPRSLWLMLIEPARAYKCSQGIWMATGTLPSPAAQLHAIEVLHLRCWCCSWCPDHPWLLHPFRPLVQKCIDHFYTQLLTSLSQIPLQFDFPPPPPPPSPCRRQSLYLPAPWIFVVDGLWEQGQDLGFFCRAKENELLGGLERSRKAAQETANLAAAKQAELQLAKQQYDTERTKGLPIEQDIERYHKSVQEKVSRQLHPADAVRLADKSSFWLEESTSVSETVPNSHLYSCPHLAW